MAALDLTGIEDRMQSAALEPALWPSLLEDLNERVGASGILLLSNEHRVSGTPATADLAHVLQDYFAQGWNRLDPRFRGMATALRRGIATDRDCTSADEMKASPYYRWLEGHGLRWFAGIVVQVRDEPWTIAIQRSVKKGPFYAEELGAMSTLCRALGEAAALSATLGMARVCGLADALEVARNPAMVLDEAGRVLAVNGLIEPLIGVSVDIKRKVPTFPDRADQHRFERLLAGTMDERPVAGPVASLAFVRDRAGQQIPVRMVLLRSWARYGFANACVLVLFGKNAIGSDTAFVLFETFYKLTRAEARLVRLLASGQSLAQAAEQFGISLETVRRQLKSVMNKTDTSRQAELVALVHTVSSV